MGDDASWYDSDDEAGGSSGWERELQKRSQEMYNSGYRDGITVGQNASMQQGFDEGLKDSVSAGYNWGLVRGITSAFSCLPDQLKAQMVEMEEDRKEFTCLGESVRSVSIEDALKMFHEDILLKEESEGRRGDSEEPRSPSSGLATLASYFWKLQLLLEKSPAIKMQLETDAKGLS
ncbi:hypothetical protein Drorol1_Dr00014402 [Drosera rotundifolia]